MDGCDISDVSSISNIPFMVFFWLRFHGFHPSQCFGSVLSFLFLWQFIFASPMMMVMVTMCFFVAEKKASRIRIKRPVIVEKQKGGVAHWPYLRVRFFCPKKNVCCEITDGLRCRRYR